MFDKVVNLCWQFWNQWLKFRSVDPITSFARFLLTLGVGLMAPGGIWWLLVVFEIKPEGLPASFSVSIGPDTVTYTGLILALLGVIIGIWGLRQVNKHRKSCLIYFRGLPGMHDSPPIKDMPPKYRYGNVNSLTINTASISPEKALAEIQIFSRILNERYIDTGTDTPFLVFAGLAPVPLLYAAGVEIANRANLITMDYNRFKLKWHTLDDMDDLEDIDITFPINFSGTEIAIALPFTIDIPKSQIPNDLSDKTIWIHLSGDGPRTDAMSSSEKLNRILKKIHDLIRNLRGKDGYAQIEKVHLFIAAQASTVFKLGTEYQPNAYPTIQIYHFDSVEGKYTWHVCVQNRETFMCNVN